MIDFTPGAAEKLRELRGSDPTRAYLRLYVAGRSCSGYQYGMAFENTTEDGDSVFETNGVRVYLDSTSAMYLEGAQVDYVDSLMGGGFRIDNPNAVSSCGCGHSFQVADEEAPAGEPDTFTEAVVREMASVLQKYHPRARLWMSLQNFSRRFSETSFVGSNALDIRGNISLGGDEGYLSDMFVVPAALVHGLLGVNVNWRGIEVKPALPSGWTSAQVKLVLLERST